MGKQEAEPFTGSASCVKGAGYFTIILRTVPSLMRTMLTPR